MFLLQLTTTPKHRDDAKLLSKASQSYSIFKKVIVF